MELESEINKASETVELLKTDQEEKNDLIWLERKSMRLVLISIFTALSTVLGYLLANFLNIELFTLTIFLSGFILGKRDGVIVGFLSSLIFCFFNTFGASPLPLLAFQLTHYSMTGFIGGITRYFMQKWNLFEINDDMYKPSVMVIFGVIGAIITISFQFFATLIGFLLYSTIEGFIPYFLSGAIFTVIHIIGNTLGFIFILPGLIQITNKLLD